MCRPSGKLLNGEQIMQCSTCDQSCVPAAPHETASRGGSTPPWGRKASAVAADASGNLMASSNL